MKSKIYLFAVVLLLLAVIAGAQINSELVFPHGTGTFWKNEKLIPVSLSFSRLYSDKELAELLEAYDAQPYAIFTYSGDLYGVYQVHERDASLRIVTEARLNQVAMQRKAMRGVRERAKTLTSQPSSGLFSDDTISRGRSLLIRHKIIEQVESDARNGIPIVYGVKLLIPQKNLPLLRRNDEVQVMRSAMTVTKAGLRLIVPDPTLKIGEERLLKRLPNFDALSSEDVLQAIQMLVNQDLQ